MLNSTKKHINRWSPYPTSSLTPAEPCISFGYTRSVASASVSVRIRRHDIHDFRIDGVGIDFGLSLAGGLKRKGSKTRAPLEKCHDKDVQSFRSQ